MIPDMAAIHPRNSAKYSPNLYRFLKQRQYGLHGKVYRAADGALWLGVLDGPYLLGARLMEVLCSGTNTSSFAHRVPEGLVEISDFWPTYMAIGRCAIDSAHEMSFAGDETRWRVDGDTRECLWCGSHHQRRERYVETVSRERWVSMEAGATQ